MYRNHLASLATGLGVGVALGGGVGLLQLLGQGYAEQGLPALAAQLVWTAAWRWALLGVAAAALLALAAERGPRRPATWALPFTGMALVLPLVLGRGTEERRLYLELLLPLAQGALAAGWARHVARRRPERALFAAAAPFVMVDLLVLLLHDAPLGLFVSPLQLVSAQRLSAQLAFDLAVPLVLGTRSPRRWVHRAWAIPGTLLLAAAGLGAALTRPPAPAGPNLVLIVVDALRADRVGGALTPALNALAARGTRFTRAYTAGASTNLAVPALLTSLTPDRHGVLTTRSVLAARALTVTEVLADRGWDTRLYNGGNVYLHEHFGFDQGFAHEYYRHMAGGAAVAEAFLHDLGGAGRFFAYLHFMDAHSPYAANAETAPLYAPAPGLVRDGAGAVDVDGDAADAQARAEVARLYDAEVRFVDAQIGRVLAGLAAAGLAEHTLVVFLADHGEELWEHDQFGHGKSAYEQLLRIPLVLAGPGVPAATIDTRVRSIDLAPTLLELLGVTAPGLRPMGTSLRALLGGAREPDRPVMAMMSLVGDPVLYAYLDGTHKLVTSAPDPGAPQKLFDLSTDPAEQHDLALAQPARAAELRRKLGRWLDGGSGEALPADTPPLDPTLRERLRALGYAQ